MINWGAVIVGFILSIIFGGIFTVIIPVWGGIIGLILAGMSVGYMVGGEPLNGTVNAALAGIFGGIVLSLLLLIAGTIILGIIGFTAATLTSLFILAGFVGVMLLMAVGELIGAVIKDEPETVA